MNCQLQGGFVQRCIWNSTVGGEDETFKREVWVAEIVPWNAVVFDTTVSQEDDHVITGTSFLPWLMQEAIMEVSKRAFALERFQILFYYHSQLASIVSL